MMTYVKTLLTLLTLCFFSSLLTGCVTLSAHCYGYSCGTPYDYGTNHRQFIESGTEQGTYRHYRPRF